MRAFFRPFLIERFGWGKRYFMDSRNPEVRARATIAYVNQYHINTIPLKWFANRIIGDCITTDLKVHQRALKSYRDFILEFFDEPEFDQLKETLVRKSADALPNQKLSLAIFDLTEKIGLTDDFPII